MGCPIHFNYNDYTIVRTTQLTIWSERKKNALKFFALLFVFSVTPFIPVGEKLMTIGGISPSGQRKTL